MDHKQIQKAVIRSQHCQRNWDLSKEIPEADLNLFNMLLHNVQVNRTLHFIKYI